MPSLRRGVPGLPTLYPLQTNKEQLTAEAKELRQKVKYLQEQLSPLTRQREYQEKEIQRLNKVGALGTQASLSPDATFPPPPGPQPSSQRAVLRASAQPRGSRCLPPPRRVPSGQPWHVPVLPSTARPLGEPFPHRAPPCSSLIIQAQF